MISNPLRNLHSHLTQVINIPSNEWDFFSSLLKPKSLKKGECYFRQGDRFQEIGFVVSGLLYNFYSDSEGNEFTKYFISENQPVTCYPGLLKKTPAGFSCRALEDTLLITLRGEELENLYQRHSCWERMGRIFAEQFYLEKDEREQHFLTKDAKDRYRIFTSQNWDLLPRIPQYLIASYLGISPGSLSRLRGSLGFSEKD